MKKILLGEFEEQVLTIVGILQDEAYGNSVVLEFKSRLDRMVNLSAVHITLYRLEDKGFVKSHMSEPTTARGGRRKRYFRITTAGLELLNVAMEQRQKLWKLLPQLKLGSNLKIDFI
jgi:DNA-binding PadR family transcriptional regulator